MLKSLWNRWIEFTRKRAERLAQQDMMLYGTGLMLRSWWGYWHVGIFKATMISTGGSSQLHGEQFFGMGLLAEPDIKEVAKRWIRHDA